MTDVEICNLALFRVGVKKKITDLDDSPEATQESQVAALLFPLMRDRLLEEFDWQFARRRALLVEATVGTPAVAATRSDWSMVYVLPTDCLVARDLVPESARYSWALEQSDNGTARWFLCHVEDAELAYTFRSVAPHTWPAAFTDALAWRLAQEFVMPLSVKPEYEAKAERGYLQALDAAMVIMVRQGRTQDTDPTPASIAARGG